MKRFWKAVGVVEQDGRFGVALDGRQIRTRGGRAQLVPTRALAEALAAEWAFQGDDIDPTGFTMRDLADYAIDQVAPDKIAAIARLLPFAETDTLCYRADPDEPLYRRQLECWEPLLTAFENRHGIRLERVSGVVHRTQPRATVERLAEVIAELDPCTVAALETLASLGASLVIGLMALDIDADVDGLFAAANCEEDWQAEQWGWDAVAKDRRDLRFATFGHAAVFAQLATATG